MKCLMVCLALMAAPPQTHASGDWLGFAVDVASGKHWEFRASSVAKLSGEIRAQVRRAEYDVYEVLIPQAHCKAGTPRGDVKLWRSGFVERAVWVKDDGTLAWEIARTICGYSRRAW